MFKQSTTLQISFIVLIGYSCLTYGFDNFSEFELSYEKQILGEEGIVKAIRREKLQKKIDEAHNQLEKSACYSLLKQKRLESPISSSNPGPFLKDVINYQEVLLEVLEKQRDEECNSWTWLPWNCCKKRKDTFDAFKEKFNNERPALEKCSALFEKHEKLLKEMSDFNESSKTVIINK